MTARSHQQIITATELAFSAFVRSKPRDAADRIHHAINDGTGAVATDSDHVTGSGGTTSTTERLALAELTGRGDRARADHQALRNALEQATHAINLANTIIDRWPAQMPRRDAEDRVLNDRCGICRTADAEPGRTVAHPSDPTRIPACEACRSSWRRITGTRRNTDEPVTDATWAEHARQRRNAMGRAESAPQHGMLDTRPMARP